MVPVMPFKMIGWERDCDILGGAKGVVHSVEINTSLSQLNPSEEPHSEITSHSKDYSSYL